MHFQSPLIKGKLVKRYKRFLADVEISDGSTITVHCANPGAMLGLAAAGSTVWLSCSSNPKRKFKHSWEMIEVKSGKKRIRVGINTAHPNNLAAEAIEKGGVPELGDYQNMRREVRYGTNSRIDILLESEGRPACYVEVKNVHLMRQEGRAEFPDSVTARGTKHLKELANMVQVGARAVMLFVVQREDATTFAIARDIDPAYGAAFDQALKAGVQIFAYKCHLSTKGIDLATALPVEI